MAPSNDGAGKYHLEIAIGKRREPMDNLGNIPVLFNECRTDPFDDGNLFKYVLIGLCAHISVSMMYTVASFCSAQV